MNRCLTGLLVGCLLAPAAPASDALLRLVPRSCQFLIVVDKPRALVDAFAQVPPLRSVDKAPPVRAALESPGVRQAMQLLKHIESEVGTTWPELLDRLTGGGIVFGFEVSKDPAPTLLVVRGTDEVLTAKVLALLVATAEGDGQTKVTRSMRHGWETLSLGKESHIARVGSVLYIANRTESLDAGLALAKSQDAAASVATHPSIPAAKAAAGPDALAWAWVDFAAVKRTPQAKDFFETTRKDLIQTLLFGGTVDAFRRGDYLVAALARTSDGFRFALTCPARRADIPKELALHIPPAGSTGSLPLLEPPGVVYSQSFHLDLKTLWTDRRSIANPETLAQLEKAEKDISRVLPGTTLGTLLQQSGPYHRLVFAHTGEKLYATESGRPIPVPAYVLSLRDPKFAASADAVLRGAALLAGGQLGGLKQEEIEVEGTRVNTYRFRESAGPAAFDPDGTRFNFVPCYAAVGDSFVVAGSPGLLKALIPELKKPAGPGHSAVWRNRVYAAGGAAFLSAHPDAAVTETVLTQGIGLAEAKKQVVDLAAWLGTLGTIGVELEHGTDAFTARFDWKLR